MQHVALESIIDAAFEKRTEIGPSTVGEVREAVERALFLLDTGQLRVAEKLPGATGADAWKVNQWLKKAVLLSFRLNDMRVVDGGPGGATWWDKIPSKFADWGQSEHSAAGFRSVPGCVVRRVSVAPRAWPWPARYSAAAPSAGRWRQQTAHMVHVSLLRVMWLASHMANSRCRLARRSQ